MKKIKENGRSSSFYTLYNFPICKFVVIKVLKSFPSVLRIVHIPLLFSYINLFVKTFDVGVKISSSIKMFYNYSTET